HAEKMKNHPARGLSKGCGLLGLYGGDGYWNIDCCFEVDGYVELNSRPLTQADSNISGDLMEILNHVRVETNKSDDSKKPGNALIRNNSGVSYVKLFNGDASRKSANFRSFVSIRRSGYARAMIELQAGVGLKDALVVDIPKFEGKGIEDAITRPPVGWKPESSFVYQLVQPTYKTSGKNKQVGLARQEVSNSNLFGGLNSIENDDDPKDKMLSEKLVLVDDDEKSQKKVGDPINADSSSGLDVVYDETAQYMPNRGVNYANLYEDEDDDIYDTYNLEDLTKQHL
nr:hypothetical protein [Tanacetum cinerariifolium]